jgi:hypothetical protein
VWPWNYSVWQIAGFEAVHFVFSFCAVFVVVSPAVFWIWITSRVSSVGASRYHSSSVAQVVSTRAAIFMVLLSLSVGLVAHVLEDIFLSWF